MPRYNILTESVKIYLNLMDITNKKKVTETLMGSEIKHVSGQRGIFPQCAFILSNSWKGCLNA
jgi:hypothetical protein